MALLKEASIDQIIVEENGIVLYRETMHIIEDGAELSKTYHRSSLVPASDLADAPANVAAICNVVWTPEVIEAYQVQITQPIAGL
jgi:hypothetical protein